MDNLQEIISNNIVKLRMQNNLAQSDLAKKLNVSEKTISKWECGESTPNVIELKQIADLFQVTVDYMLVKQEKNKLLINRKTAKHNLNTVPLTFLSVSPVWIIATLIFTLIAIFTGKYIWYIFYISVPITMLLFIIFNSIWGNRRNNYYIISVFIWSILFCLYFTLYQYKIWQIFFLGIPAQITIYLWSRLKK